MVGPFASQLIRFALLSCSLAGAECANFGCGTKRLVCKTARPSSDVVRHTTQRIKRGHRICVAEPLSLFHFRVYPAPAIQADLFHIIGQVRIY